MSSQNLLQGNRVNAMQSSLSLQPKGLCWLKSSLQFTGLKFGSRGVLADVAFEFFADSNIDQWIKHVLFQLFSFRLQCKQFWSEQNPGPPRWPNSRATKVKRWWTSAQSKCVPLRVTELHCFSCMQLTGSNVLKWFEGSVTGCWRNFCSWAELGRAEAWASPPSRSFFWAAFASQCLSLQATALSWLGEMTGNSEHKKCH